MNPRMTMIARERRQDRWLSSYWALYRKDKSREKTGSHVWSYPAKLARHGKWWRVTKRKEE
jgi:hypothetical protein